MKKKAKKSAPKKKVVKKVAKKKVVKKAKPAGKGCSCRGKLMTLLEKYKGHKGSVMPALQEAQAELGYLSEEAMMIISEVLKVPVSQLYGVATFYTQFRLRPAGKYIVKVCHGTACHVGGAEKISEAVDNELGLKEGVDTSADGRFTVEAVACLGCCSLAPVVMVDTETYGRLTPEKASKIVKEFGK